MEAGLNFHPSCLADPRRAWQAVRTVNRDTLSTMATVIVAVVALGAFVRDEIGDVRDEIGGVRSEIQDVRTEIRDVRTEIRDVRDEIRDDIAEIRGDIADLRERMVRVEMLLGISRSVAVELAPGHGNSASP